MSPDPTPSPDHESSRRLLLRSGRVAAATATGAVMVVSAYALAANATSDDVSSSDAVDVLDTSTIPTDGASTAAVVPDTTDGAAIVPATPAPPSSTDAASDDAIDDATSDDATDEVGDQIVPDGSPMTDDDAMPAAPSGAGETVGGGRHGGGDHGEHGGDARGVATTGSSGAVPSAPSGQPASSSGGS